MVPMSRPRSRCGGAPLLLGGLALLAARPAAAGVLTVGAGDEYATLGAAVAAAGAGDTIDVTAGTYGDPDVTINVPLTIVGVGGMAVFTSPNQLLNDKGFLVANADLTVANLAFVGAYADSASNNGAGIRYQSGNLTVLDSAFTGDQDGILATPNVAGTGTVVVNNSTFTDDGAGDGFSHALYATDLAALTVTNSYFACMQAGHDIKSRAADTVIENNFLDDGALVCNGVTSTTSYAIDLSNGGNATITGNTIDQGPNTSNSNMIAYDTEGLIYGDNTALIDGNAFINSDPDGSVGVLDDALPSQDVSLTVACNAFDDVQQPVNAANGAPVTEYGNVSGSALPACAHGVPAPSGRLAVAPALLVLLAARRRRRIDASTAAP